MIRLDTEENFGQYTEKALEAFDTLLGGKGEGCEYTGWITLPDDTAEETIRECESVVSDWQKKGIDLVTVIGIGGSYLGARCAIDALSHSFIRKEGTPQIVFAGNSLSGDYLAELMDLAQQRNTACVVISKSGTTTEPAIAFRIVKKFIEERYSKAEAKERIVAITDARKGALKTLADNEGYRTFTIPDNVGGRFSVLTPVGLLPIALAGFDIRAMIEGARESRKNLLTRSADNPAIKYAAARNAIYQTQGKKVEILASFNPKLQSLGEWWKQLFGESEGKDGKGIFPASVTFTTDLHSMGQYIQDGERQIFETVVNVEESGREVLVESDPQDLDKLNYLTGKSVEHCNSMARLGTRMAHIDGGVPQISVSIDRIDEKSLGELFYFFEFSCGISGYMLGVNPFNQPGVEAYKKNMFKLLEKPE